MTTSIIVLGGRTIGGTVYADGETASVADSLAEEMVGAGLATYADGARSGWISVSSLFRVLLTGTGNCVIDSRDRLGAITESVASFVASSATNQIEFPYPGPAAVEIRFRLTGTCKAEVLR
jgi:hypothetical protein